MIEQDIYTAAWNSLGQAFDLRQGALQRSQVCLRSLPCLTIPQARPCRQQQKPMENGRAAAHGEEQEVAEALPAGLPRVQTEGAAFSPPEKDQLSSPHLMAATMGQVLRIRAFILCLPAILRLQ